MTPLRTTLALLLVLTAVLLVAGCVGGEVIEKNPVGDGEHVAPTVSIIQPVQPQWTLQDNSTTWIRIDPIPDQYVPAAQRTNYTGNFFINGTTNLMPGGEVVLTMRSTCSAMPCPKWSVYNHNIGCCGDGIYSGTAKIVESASGINTWSVLVNTTPTTIQVTTVNGVAGDYNSVEVNARGPDRVTGYDGQDTAYFFMRLRSTAQ